MTDSIDTRDEEKLLECAICLGRLIAPRKLDCRHVYCFPCIKNHYINYGKRLTPCPICRKLYPSMNGKVDNLPQCSIPLHELLDTRNSRHFCGSELCQNTNAPFLCLKCKKWLCFTCTEHTDETAPCQSHDAYRISDIDVRLYNIVVQSQDKSCVEHPDQEVQWFCRQCHVLGCNYCKRRQPLNHSLIGVDEKAMELRELFKDVCALLKKKTEEHEKIREFFHDLSDRLSPLGVCNVDLCEKSANEHKGDVSECNSLIQIVTYLTEYASDEVVVAMYLNMEDQIASEIDKQPLEKLGNTQQWLGDTNGGLASSEGTEMLTNILNKRRTPKNDTDLSKKINLTYYCNLIAMVLAVAIGVISVLCIFYVFYYWSDIWQDIKNKFYATVVEFLHSRLEGMLKEVFNPSLMSEYIHVMNLLAEKYMEVYSDSMNKSLDFLKLVKNEICHKNTLTRYSNYRGDFQFQYKLDVSTFCDTD